MEPGIIVAPEVAVGIVILDVGLGLGVGMDVGRGVGVGMDVGLGVGVGGSVQLQIIVVGMTPPPPFT